MKPHSINFFLGIVLIAMSLWGYFGSASPSPTAFIPAVFGIIFVLCTPAFRKENKVVAHVVVVLTLLLIIALIKPFMGALGDGRTMAMVRVGIMLVTAIVALIIYINSFIAARKAKQS